MINFEDLKTEWLTLKIEKHNGALCRTKFFNANLEKQKRWQILKIDTQNGELLKLKTDSVIEFKYLGGKGYVFRFNSSLSSFVFSAWCAPKPKNIENLYQLHLLPNIYNTKNFTQNY